MKDNYSKIKIEILYKDKDMLILNKPAGLVTHPDGRTDEPSLSNWLLKHYPKVNGVGEVLNYEDGRVIEKWGIVHRLDRETSGVIVVALNQKSFLFLKEQFQSREVRKIYHAFVWGEIKEDEGDIERPIGRSRKDPRLWSAQRGARGEMRDALTLYKILWRGRGVSFAEIEPKTGRTHQIRVHFKAINYPVVCDKIYGPGRGCGLGFERVALHSRSIEIHNLNGELVRVQAPYPADFENALLGLGITKPKP
jgi:23S rRNA pseudouridine1911/1915/1917 synthase